MTKKVMVEKIFFDTDKLNLGQEVHLRFKVKTAIQFKILPVFVNHMI